MSVDLMRSPRRDIIGTKVRLRRTLKTRGGQAYRVGRIMKIGGRWGGLFDLRTLRIEKMRPHPDGGMFRRFGINKVSRHEFEVVAWP